MPVIVWELPKHNLKEKTMLKRLCLAIMVACMVVLAGCSGTTIPAPVLEAGLNTLAQDKAIQKDGKLTVYSCWGGTQQLANWKPVSGTFGLWPDTVLVADEGYMFTVDTPKKDGVFESTHLYTTVKDYVDVGIQAEGLTRYYRINHPSLMFAKSNLDVDGNGTTTIIFNCSTDRAKIADPSTVKVID